MLFHLFLVSVISYVHLGFILHYILFNECVWHYLESCVCNHDGVFYVCDTVLLTYIDVCLNLWKTNGEL